MIISIIVPGAHVRRATLSPAQAGRSRHPARAPRGGAARVRARARDRVAHGRSRAPRARQPLSRHPPARGRRTDRGVGPAARRRPRRRAAPLLPHHAPRRGRRGARGAAAPRAARHARRAHAPPAPGARMSRRARFSERAYRVLLAAHPRDVRARYGEAMAEHFDDLCADARSGGSGRGLAALWLRALADLASSATRNHIDAAAARVARPAVAPHTSSGGSVLRTLAYDLRFSLRVLRKSPVLTATAVLVIALGTGAVSTIFSVADAVVLRPLPGVSRPAEVVNVQRSQGVGGSLSASYLYYKDLASRSKTLRGLTAWSMQPLTVSLGGQGISA